MNKVNCQAESSKRKRIEDNQKLGAILNQITEVFAISASAQNIINLSSCPNADLKAVVDAVSKDPAMSSEVLRISNSPLFGQNRTINSVGKAIVVIGMQELNTMSTAMAMMSAFSIENEVSKKIHDSSVLSATLAKLMAQEIGFGESSAAFVCGLLCEIGALACLSVDTESYREIWNSYGASPSMRSAHEQERYGATSEEIGSQMLIRNNLPEDVCEAIAASSTRFGPNLSQMSKLTVFARLATPLLIESATEGRQSIMNEDVPILAEKLWPEGIDRKNLFNLCLSAASTAELSLKGEIMLVDQETEDACKSTPPRGTNPSPKPAPQSTYRKILGIFSGKKN